MCVLNNNDVYAFTASYFMHICPGTDCHDVIIGGVAAAVIIILIIVYIVTVMTIIQVMRKVPP